MTDAQLKQIENNMKKELQETIEKLESIAEDVNRSGLERAVATSIVSDLEDYEDAADRFKDIMQGCASGVVSELIYTADCHEFYDENYSDIEDLRAALENDLGEKVAPSGDQDLKTFYAWLAYEETARELAAELGIDI